MDAIPDQEAARPQTARIVVEFVFGNFAAISALAIVAGVVFSLSFVYAYLTVFDWHLVWLIEYVDVIKFGVVGTALASGSFVALDNASRLILAVVRSKGGERWAKIAGIATGVIFVLSLDVLSLVRSDSPLYFAVAMRWSCYVAIAFLAAQISLLIPQFTNAAAGAIASIVLVSLFTTILLGTAFGAYARDADTFKESVFVKEYELDDVKIVMVTSRFAILYTTKKEIVTVPLADISRMVVKQRSGQ